MIEDKKGDLEIKACSQELFSKAINTVPINPISGDLFFTPRGIINPNLCDPEQLEVYEQQCKQEGIMPLSCIEFNYDSDKDLFAPRLEQPYLIISNKMGLEKTVKGLALGGKWSLQIFHFMGSIIPRSPLEVFRNNYYPLLLNNGYQLNSGVLVLKGKKYKSSLGNLDLKFIDKKMILNFGCFYPLYDQEEYDKEELATIDGWFRQLSA